MVADFVKRLRQFRAELRQEQPFARRLCRRRIVGRGNIAFAVAGEVVRRGGFARLRARRGVAVHDDFERVVVAGFAGGAQLGDLRPLPLAEPAPVFVKGGEAVFVADEDGRIPEQTDEAAMADEREGYGVDEWVPGEPGGATAQVFGVQGKQRGGVAVADGCGDEPGEQAVGAEGVVTPPDESVGGLAVGGKQRAGHGWGGWLR